MRRACVCLVALAVLASPLGAQRRPSNSRRAASTATNATAVRAELAALLLQSGRYDDAAREYRALVARDTANTAYRLGLVRALAWGDHPREAEREAKPLAARRPANAVADSILRSIRESYEPTAAEASVWVGERPDFLTYRVALARALVRERRVALAAAQYDTLIAQSPTAPLYVERAHVRLSLGDTRGAETDFNASLAAQPTADAYLGLGDLYEGRGELAAASTMYRAAAARSDASNTLAIDAALARLAREQRPMIAFAPSVGDDPGWHFTSEAAGDNVGVRYAVSALQRTYPLGEVTAIDAALRYDQLSERSSTRVGESNGFAGTVGLSTGTSLGRLLGRVSLGGGASVHPIAGTIPEGRAAAAVWMDAWQIGAELMSGAAYPSLLTLASLLPTDSAVALREVSSTITAGGPVGAGDVALDLQRSRLSDGNERTTLQAYVRFPLEDRLYAVYAATGIFFTEPSELYWDPRRYVSHLAGVELAERRTRGWSYGMRVLPGYAWTFERARSTGVDVVPLGEEQLVRRRAFQLTGGGEASFRTAGWEVTAGANYGRGRAGDYERLGLSLAFRVTP